MDIKGQSFLISLCFAITSMTSGCAASDHPSAVRTASNIAEANIAIEGMSCASCVARIKSKVRSLAGVKTVEVSLETRRAKVSYDPQKITVDEIRKQIENLGYRTANGTKESK
jgi:copper ion binding protein